MGQQPACGLQRNHSLGPVEERPEAPVITLMLSSSRAIELTWWEQQGVGRQG